MCCGDRDHVVLPGKSSEAALAEAHAEIARLTAECDEVKEKLKEALVGVSYGRMCDKELRALRTTMTVRRMADTTIRTTLQLLKRHT